jgi:hypothetical protein
MKVERGQDRATSGIWKWQDFVEGFITRHGVTAGTGIGNASAGGSAVAERGGPHVVGAALSSGEAAGVGVFAFEQTDYWLSLNKAAARELDGSDSAGSRTAGPSTRYQPELPRAPRRDRSRSPPLLPSSRRSHSPPAPRGRSRSPPPRHAHESWLESSPPQQLGFASSTFSHESSRTHNSSTAYIATPAQERTSYVRPLHPRNSTSELSTSDSHHEQRAPLHAMSASFPLAEDSSAASVNNHGSAAESVPDTDMPHPSSHLLRLSTSSPSTATLVRPSPRPIPTCSFETTTIAQDEAGPKQRNAEATNHFANWNEVDDTMQVDAPISRSSPPVDSNSIQSISILGTAPPRPGGLLSRLAAAKNTLFERVGQSPTAEAGEGLANEEAERSLHDRLA